MTRSPGCRTGRCSPTGSSMQSLASDGTVACSRCCSSTWTGSSLSTTRSASTELRELRPADAIGVERKRIAAEFLDEVRQADRALLELRSRIKSAVAAANTTVTDVRGVGAIVACYRSATAATYAGS
jgi:hypothetical protein